MVKVTQLRLPFKLLKQTAEILALAEFNGYVIFSYPFSDSILGNGNFSE